MFICSECGAKYEIMPKFCDCGNDIFIEEKETQTQISDIEIPQEQPARRKGRGKIESFSPIAVGIFVLCLILSFTVLFFIGNPKKEIIAEEQNTQIQPEETVEIPSIDSFWDNTIAKIEQKEEPQEEPKEKPIIDKMPKFVQNIIPQETKKVQIPKVNKANIKPAIPAKVQQTSKTSTQKVQQTPQVQTQTNQQAQAVTNRIKQQYNNPAPQNSAQTQTSQPIQTTKTPPACALSTNWFFLPILRTIGEVWNWPLAKYVIILNVFKVSGLISVIITSFLSRRYPLNKSASLMLFSNTDPELFNVKIISDTVMFPALSSFVTEIVYISSRALSAPIVLNTTFCPPSISSYELI